MGNQRPIKPGEITPRSGIYERTDRTQVALSKGDRAPAGQTGTHGQTWTLKTPTRQPRRK